MVISNWFCSYFTNIGPYLAKQIPFSSQIPVLFSLQTCELMNTIFLDPVSQLTILEIVKFFVQVPLRVMMKFLYVDCERIYRIHFPSHCCIILICLLNPALFRTKWKLLSLYHFSNQVMIVCFQITDQFRFYQNFCKELYITA